MPRLRRIPSELAHPDDRRRHLINPTGGKRKKLGGRAKGTANLISRSVRESIIEGLARAGGGGPEGVVRYVTAAAKADYKYGIALMSLVCPKAIEANIRHEQATLVTIEDLDIELQKAGLPPSSEIFKVDYKGSQTPEEPAVDGESEVIK
jgi:hypothetical protein